MSLATYGDLKTSVASWSTYTDVSSLLDDFCFWAHQEINRRLRANVMLASTDLTINAETISQPTGFLAFKRVYLDLSPRQRLFTVSAESAMDMSAAYGTSSYPTHIAVEGTELRFAPLFTATVTGKALYYKEATLMVADSDANAVLTKYPYLYLFGALEALHTYKEDDANAQAFGGKFGALIEDINSREAADVMSGPLQMSNPPGGVV
jgi:hypothetical protein